MENETKERNEEKEIWRMEEGKTKKHNLGEKGLEEGKERREKNV